LAFHGTFEHTLDAKNRLTVPSKFRTALAGRIFLVRDVDRCISVYPEETYSEFTRAALSGLNPFSTQARELKRMLYGNAMDTELDAAGRVMIPAPYMDHAGITSREVVVTGAGECLELWNRESWQAYHADLTQRAPDLTASLGPLPG
jgi:MraZ protein